MTDEWPCRYDCGKVLKSRAGIYKHEQKCSLGNTDTIGSNEPEYESASGEVPSSSSLPFDTKPDVGTETSDNEEWMDFELGGDNETDSIPAALKMITATPTKKKKTPKELKAIKDTEVGLLKMLLGGIDVVLTQYGKGVTLDKEFEVRHGDKTKTLVAGAQHAYLEEKGITISKYASKGMIAGSLTAYYVGAPIMRIKKEAKKPMIKRIGGGFKGFLSRLPLIGRLFKKKVEEPSIFDDTGDDEQ